MAPKIKETELYPAVKSFLEGQNYEVKGEVGAADVVAMREDEVVIVELKTGFSLSLFHQGLARQAVTEAVYLAVPRGKGKAFGRSLKENIGLARRLGLGLMTVRLRDNLLEVHCDPGPYRPRASLRRKTMLLKEFARRTGDPNKGGATRIGLVTAYRQDALRCANYLVESGASRGRDVAKATRVDRATRLMAADHYGWFQRVDTGIYDLTEKGRSALKDYPTPDPLPDDVS